MPWFQPTKSAATDLERREIDLLEQSDGVPGTNDLVDVKNERDDIHHRGKDVVLIPQPSADPNDPLNWSYFRKCIFMSQAIFATFLICALTAIFGITTEGLESVGVDNTVINRGTAASFILFGWMNVLFQPLSMSYGRKFLVLMMSFGCGVAAVMWDAYSFSNGSYYGARILQGILGAPVESLVEVLVADVFFEHERALWMSLYGFALQGGATWGPVAGAWMAQNMSWQWVFYFIAIFSGAIGVIMIFCFEESGYVRKFPVIEGDPLPNVTDSSKDAEKGSESLNLQESPRELGGLEQAPAPKTYWKRIQFFTKLRPFPTFSQFARPLMVLYKLPHIQWAGWMVASSLCGFNVVTGTITMVFSAPPYNFSVGSIGLCYIGAAVGVIIGVVASGPFNDWICLQIARARGGKHEAEDRIYVSLPLIVLFPAGYIMYGVGAARGVHWSCPIIGLGVLGYCMVNSSVVPYTYAIDAASGIGSDCIVAIILMRNTIGFAVSFGITPWIQGLGVQNALISVAFIFGFLFWITTVPMLIWGKQSRVRSASTYYDWVAESGSE